MHFCMKFLLKSKEALGTLSDNFLEQLVRQNQGLSQAHPCSNTYERPPRTRPVSCMEGGCLQGNYKLKADNEIIVKFRDQTITLSMNSYFYQLNISDQNDKNHRNENSCTNYTETSV